MSSRRVWELFQNCSRTVFELFWNCSGTVLEQFLNFFNCSWTVLELFLNSFWTVPEQFLKSFWTFSTVLEWFKDSSRSVQEEFYSRSQTVLELFFNYSWTFFELFKTWTVLELCLKSSGIVLEMSWNVEEEFKFFSSSWTFWTVFEQFKNKNISRTVEQVQKCCQVLYQVLYHWATRPIPKWEGTPSPYGLIKNSSRWVQEEFRNSSRLHNFWTDQDVNSSWTVLEKFLNFFGNVLEKLKKSSKTVQELFTSWTVQELFKNCSTSVQEQLKNSWRRVQELLQNCSTTVLERWRIVLELFLNSSWSGLNTVNCSVNSFQQFLNCFWAVQEVRKRKE